MSWYDKFKTGTKDYLVKGKQSASSFWYDDYDTSFDYLEQYGSYQKKDLDAFKKTHNLYKLASVRRAISNFVQIVTNKSIPVTFATKSESKTDGEKVILSADVDDNFDVSVGLALHEGSHIVLSDFKLLKAMSDVKSSYLSHLRYSQMINEKAIKEGNPIQVTPEQIQKNTEGVLDSYAGNYRNQLAEIYLNTGKIGSKGYPTEEVLDIIAGLTNWIEDRRIDHYIYNSAPGYRDYYITMYDHYFNDKVITKGVNSDEFTEETWESYMFRIINLLNENTNLSKLKGLRAIYRLLDLKNISRLKNSGDALNVAIDVVAEVLKYVSANPQPQQKGNGTGNGDGDGENEVEITDIEDGDGEDSGDQMGGANGQMNGQVTAKLGNSDSGEGQDGNTKVKLSKSAAEQLKKKFQKQKDFLNGDIKKKKITNQENEKLDDIQESGTEMVRVGTEYERNGKNIGKGVDCIVVKKLTKKVLESEDFPFTGRSWKSDGLATPYADEVKRGTILGTLLGKKLQIRNESRETIFSRLKKGKIDGRMIASLGFDNENVFSQIFTDKFKKANIHLTIDASGSMGGTKWRQTMINVIALAKATSMISNLEMQITFRYSDNNLPIILFAYDSRKDSYQKVRSIFPYLKESGTTPEGLTFEAIQKMLVPSSNDMDSFFVNISDGEPAFQNRDMYYTGSPAAEHTKKQVDKIRANGIGVLSYFVSDSSYGAGASKERFKKMYGNDAKFIDINSIGEVTTTLNKMFLTK